MSRLRLSWFGSLLFNTLRQSIARRVCSWGLLLLLLAPVAAAAQPSLTELAADQKNCPMASRD